MRYNRQTYSTDGSELLHHAEYFVEEPTSRTWWLIEDPTRDKQCENADIQAAAVLFNLGGFHIVQYKLDKFKTPCVVMRKINHEV